MNKEEKEKTLEGIKKFTGSDDVEILDENDTFDFSCKQCGRCCMHREDIILSPFDVYNAAKYLNITPKEFVDKNAVVTLGSESKIPMILLKNVKGKCPLLKFDIKDGGKFKCSINPAKPGACYAHPLGTVWQKNTSTGELERYYIKVSQCDNSKIDAKPQLVKNWMKYSIEHQEEIDLSHYLQTFVNEYIDLRKVYHFTNFIMMICNEEEVKTNEELKDCFDKLSGMSLSIMKDCTEHIIKECYINYDTSEDFIKQANTNKNKLAELFESIKPAYEEILEILEKGGIDIDELINKQNGDED